MDGPLQVNLTTPDGQVWAGRCESVVAPSHDGMVGVLRRHCPFVTLLGSGAAHFVSATETMTFVVHGGFMKVLDDHVVLMANAAEDPKAIDLERAREAERRALERLKEGGRGVDVERAKHELEKARLRLKAGAEGAH